MVCTTEKYLEVRVDASGRIDGDVFSGLCIPRFPWLFSSFTRRQAQLDAKQLDELEAVLKQSDLSMIKESYPQFAVYDDSGTFETIKFETEGKERTVSLVNPDPSHPSNKENYPIALINILLEIQKARQQLEIPVR